jgi:internalin A
MNLHLLVLCLLLVSVAAIRADEVEEKSLKVVDALEGEYERANKREGKPVIKVELRGEKVTDERLKELLGLKQLQSLTLYRTAVTDAGLKGLAGFPRLQSLSLFATGVSDAGLKEISGLKQLQSLNRARSRPDLRALPGR